MIVELTGRKRCFTFPGQVPNTRATGDYQLSPPGLLACFSPPFQTGGKGFQIRFHFTAKHIKSKGLRLPARSVGSRLFSQEGVEEGVSHEGIVPSPAYDSLLVDDNRGGQTTDPVGVPAAASLI